MPDVESSASCSRIAINLMALLCSYGSIVHVVLAMYFWNSATMPIPSSQQVMTVFAMFHAVYQFLHFTYNQFIKEMGWAFTSHELSVVRHGLGWLMNLVVTFASIGVFNSSFTLSQLNLGYLLAHLIGYSGCLYSKKP